MSISLIKRIAIWTGAFIGVVLLTLTVWFFLVTQDLPSEKDLADYEPPIMSRVHAGDGRLVAEFATQHRVYVPSEELPDQLIQAFISAEDKEFFEHSGINLVGILRGAVLNPLMGKRQSGGSTITQQVVKNMLVGSERSLDRKVREAVLAMRIEKQLTKEEILELYMNEIYLGGRSYGVGAAALNYFGKSLSQLSLSEAALLAGLAQAPGRANPYNNADAAMKRRDYVLGRMLANGYVDKAQADAAKAEPLATIERLDTDENQASAYYVEELRRDILKLGKDGKLTGFADEKQAQKAFYEGGLSIRSTLDSNLQLIAQTALRAGLETYDHRHGWRGALGKIAVADTFEDDLKNFANSKDGKLIVAGAGNTWQLALVRSASKEGAKLGLADGTAATLVPEDAKWAAAGKNGLKAGDIIFVSREATPDVGSQMITEYGAPKKGGTGPVHIRQIPEVQGALVAMDPHTGRVYAMAGGYAFQRSQFNRAMQAKRQPGSSFKPFVYAAALENGKTPSSRILDAPYVSCDATQEECYRPENYSRQFFGLSTLRFGVEKSMNTMTLRLAGDIGLDKVSELGERMGMYDKLPAYESMALGAGETTPMRMVTAYAELVNGGKQVKPVMFDRIQNRYGETVYRTDARPCDGCTKVEWKKGLQPPQLPDERTQLMDPVTAYQMVSILEGVVERGTAATARSIGKPVAAKTGTTNDQVDAWTVGFSPDLVVGIWIGFDTPKNMGDGETGGRLAAPVFRDFMLAALKDRPPLNFRIPEGVQQVEVDYDSGCLPAPETTRVILEAFKPGTGPTERCEAGGGNEGYRVDRSAVVAGDESSAPPPTPGPDVASTQPIDPTMPVDPNQPPQQPQPQQPQQDLNGIF